MKQIQWFFKKYYLYFLIGFFVVGINLCLLFRLQAILILFFEILFGAIGIYLILYDQLKLFYVAVIAIPLSVSVNIFQTNAMSFPSEGLIAIFALMFLGKSIIKTQLNLEFLYHPITILLIVDLLWFILASTFSTIPLFSFKRSLMKFIFLSVFYFFIANLFSRKQNFSRIYILYGLGLIVPIFTAMLFHAKYNFMDKAAYKMTLPFFNDHTIYGAVLAFLIPILIVITCYREVFNITKKANKGLWALLVLIVIAFLLSFSRAAWLSMLLCLIFMLVIYFKISFKMLLLGIALLAAIIFYNFDTIADKVVRNDSRSNTGNVSEHIESFANVQSDASNTERINRWKCAIRMFYDRPYFGFGPGTYQYNYGSYQVRSEMTRISTVVGNRGHAHSEYMTYLSETGLPGFVIFIVIIFCTIYIGMRVIYRSRVVFTRLIATGLLLGLFTFYIHSVFNAFLDTDKVAILYYSALAGLVVLDISVKKEDNPNADIKTI